MHCYNILFSRVLTLSIINVSNLFLRLNKNMDFSIYHYPIELLTLMSLSFLMNHSKDSRTQKLQLNQSDESFSE